MRISLPCSRATTSLPTPLAGPSSTSMPKRKSSPSPPTASMPIAKRICSLIRKRCWIYLGGSTSLPGIIAPFPLRSPILISCLTWVRD